LIAQTSEQKFAKATSEMDGEGGGSICNHHHAQEMGALPAIGSRLTIHTDCKCLEYLAKYQDTWGKLGRRCSYLSMYSYKLKWCARIENGCADWLSRAPQLDNYCPDGGELEKEKCVVDDAGNLQFVDSFELRREASSTRRQRLQAMSADRTKGRKSKRPTPYSVCAGIGSCMQAKEKFNIPMDFIGCCEVDPEVFAELWKRRSRMYPTMAICAQSSRQWSQVSWPCSQT
jgi:hypothetical protein